ncbi:DUF2607 family protein [Vibrio genomosp. F10]|uniref:DUF2607 domain-containing protein n=1 Tax=Vibrio genomosp. F10 TaxID=723171 RepID=A0A1B9QYY3_9VIBR|nr:DUF2607 family protein [Vibrio genomosp. F10]OCH75871.1 hypothetical protein A6E14_10280 [Vibrio genomosp. F10]
MPSTQPIQSVNRFVIACALIAVLWLNFAYIEHQTDLTPEHHNQHQCELFSSLGHGLNHSLSIADMTVIQYSPLLTYVADTVAASFYAYLARSPPL